MNPEDAYSPLLEQRIVFLGNHIDDQVASMVMAQLMFLETEDPESDVYLHINSPGGSVTASFAILDLMDSLRMDVSTVCLGQAVGTAALILAAGKRSKRFVLPNAQVTLVPLREGSASQSTSMDAQTQLQAFQRLSAVFLEKLAKATARTVTQVAAAMNTGGSFPAEEAVTFGFVDAIRTRSPALDSRR